MILRFIRRWPGLRYEIRPDSDEDDAFHEKKGKQRDRLLPGAGSIRLSIIRACLYEILVTEIDKTLNISRAMPGRIRRTSRAT